jgi:hypothetical protein
MKTIITPVAVLASLALAMPAAAHDKPVGDQPAPAAKSHPCEAPAKAKAQKCPDATPPAPGATSQKCRPRTVSYRVSGTLVSGTLTQNPDGTYNGTLVVHVTNTNHHAKTDKGTDKSYAVDHAKVKPNEATAAALTPGSRVKLKGTVTKLGRKCDQTGFTPATTIKKATIKPPKVS